MTLVTACPDCVYGALQGANDPKGTELIHLCNIHNSTFKHSAVVRQATMEDIVKFTKQKK